MSSTNVHNTLEARRAIKKVSRKDLADAIGVNYQTIGYIERGDYAPSIQVALQIAEFFETPVESIFSLYPLQAELSTKQIKDES